VATAGGPAEQPGGVLELRPCPEARRWTWAAFAIGLVGVWMVIGSSGDAFFAVGGVVVATVFGWMTVGMWRCRVVVTNDQITIRNVWRTHRLPRSPSLSVATRTALGYWTFGPESRLWFPKVTAVVLKDTATGRTYSCEALRCQSTSADYPDFLANVEHLKALLPKRLPPPPATPVACTPD
jgi:hypothetical protein